jgi:purine-binding chemotaxis protein CheW
MEKKEPGDPRTVLTHKEEILKKRAEQLAKLSDEPFQTGDTMSGLSILLSDETYIIDSYYVVEVLPLTEITPLPCTPPFIMGIINVRGRILSVINLKFFLNLPYRGITNLNRVIVVKNENIEVGLLVDDILGYNVITIENLQKGLLNLTPEQLEFINGITSQGEIIFRLKEFLCSNKICINEEV